MSLAGLRLLVELWWQQRRTPPVSLDTFLEARNEYDEAGRAMGVAPDVVATPDRVGHVPVEVLVIDGAEDRTVLYLHGGAYVMGSLDASRQGATQLGRAGRARVVNVGYRLAPEHPFPAAVDDALTIYRWLVTEQVPPERVVVCGSSAGGGLALATLLAASEAGLPRPAGLVTLSAWTDLRCTARTYRTRARRDPALTPNGLRLAASLYLRGASPHQPLASPLLGGLADLPPTLALVGTEEILLDDTLALVEAIRGAGGEAASHIGRGMVHCWTGFAGQIPESDAALDVVGRFIRERTPER